MKVVTAELDRVVSQERGVPVTLTMPPPPQDDSSSVVPREAPEGAAHGPEALPPSPQVPKQAPAAPPASADDLIVPEEGGTR
jgi:hypothetical protein